MSGPCFALVWGDGCCCRARRRPSCGHGLEGDCPLMIVRDARVAGRRRCRFALTLPLPHWQSGSLSSLRSHSSLPVTVQRQSCPPLPHSLTPPPPLSNAACRRSRATLPSPRPRLPLCCTSGCTSCVTVTAPALARRSSTSALHSACLCSRKGAEPPALPAGRPPLWARTARKATWSSSASSLTWIPVWAANTIPAGSPCHLPSPLLLLSNLYFSICRVSHLHCDSRRLR